LSIYRKETIHYTAKNYNLFLHVKKTINPADLYLQAAQHTHLPRGKPDKAGCYGTMRATLLQKYKKLPKYTPFSWIYGY